MIMAGGKHNVEKHIAIEGGQVEVACVQDVGAAAGPYRVHLGGHLCSMPSTLSLPFSCRAPCSSRGDRESNKDILVASGVLHVLRNELLRSMSQAANDGILPQQAYTAGGSLHSGGCTTNYH
jgi:hypothetical protein